MSTPVGRWLAQHVPVFARAWAQSMNRSLVEEAHVKLVYARAEVGVAADSWVGAMSRPERKAAAEQRLLNAVVNERNALVHLVRLTTGDEAADALMYQVERIDRGEPPE